MRSPLSPHFSRLNRPSDLSHSSGIFPSRPSPSSSPYDKDICQLWPTFALFLPIPEWKILSNYYSHMDSRYYHQFTCIFLALSNNRDNAAYKKAASFGMGTFTSWWAHYKIFIFTSSTAAWLYFTFHFILHYLLICLYCTMLQIMKKNDQDKPSWWTYDLSKPPSG